MLQALCDEHQRLADALQSRRDELRSMFAAIIAEEAQRIPTDPISTEPLPTAGAPTEPAPAEPQPVGAQPNGAPQAERHAEVETEVHRILTEAGLEAGLEGILVHARAEAERSGIALDQDLMLEALCDEISGSAKLSDTAREELRSVFAGIIAEEAQQAPAALEQVRSVGQAARLRSAPGGRGEIGRHAAFRSPWAKAHGGSSPSART